MRKNMEDIYMRKEYRFENPEAYIALVTAVNTNNWNLAIRSTHKPQTGKRRAEDRE